jgi:hypothetical protein
MASPTAVSLAQPGRANWRAVVVLAASVAILAWVARMSPLAQDPRYHDFVDQRRLLGVPHFWNVVSNLPFAFVGLLGCWWLIRWARGPACSGIRARQAYFVFFLGELLTCFGSGYYHANPTNATLVWDRLAFSLMLTSFFAIVIQESVSLRAGRLILAPGVLLGLYSVLHWSLSESAGRGDLRLYLLVQFYPVIATPLLILLYRPRSAAGGALLLTWALYALAKACELYDAPIYGLTGCMSGHTFKHLIAAGASYVPLHVLRRRARRAEDMQTSSRCPAS